MKRLIGEIMTFTIVLPPVNVYDKAKKNKGFIKKTEIVFPQGIQFIKIILI